MDKAAVIARISCISGHGQFYVWATEKERPTGIEPRELNEHIKGCVMETLHYLNEIDMPECFDSYETRELIIGEIDYFEEYGFIRHSC